jgi:rod shape determining protein RodA
MIMNLLNFKKEVKYFDLIFFLLIFAVLIFGLLIQYSLSLGLESKTLFSFKRQLFFIFLGIILFFLFSFIDFRIFKLIAYFLYLFSIFLLGLVLFFGIKFHGVKGWYFLKFAYFQPIELVKIILIIVLAKIWSNKVKERDEKKLIFLSAVFTFPLVFLTLLQPDFGSALILVLIWFFLTAINIQKIRDLAFILISFIIIFVLLWNFVLLNYQKERIITFFFPGRDPMGKGYQITQAKIAVGSGGIFGRGIGQGSRGQMRLLPASKTDFVFAAISEELGFFGSAILILLFILIFLRIIKISKVINDSFGFFLVLGIGFNLFLHVIINIGMNLGLLPIVGLPLPLVSYGGSSLICFLISLGIIESVVIHQEIFFT